MHVAVITEGDPDRVSGGSLYHRRIADLAKDHGSEMRFVSVPERIFPLAAADGPAVVRSAAADADVVVVDSLASNTLGPLLGLGLGRRLPMVGSIHQPLGGMGLGRVRRTVQARFDRLAWARCRRLVLPSEMLASQLVADGVPRHRMAVIQPGRDVPEARIAGAPPLDLRHGRAAAVICVANWLAHKGITEVLDAVAALPDPSVTLHLVGNQDVDPHYRQRVQARAAEADLAQRVVCHGIVAPGAMAAMYEAADVFVLASTQEPYGMVYGEAMALGLPVVGWTAGNLPNLVDDDVEGVLVPTGDVRALSTALAELAVDEPRRARLGAAARARSDGLPTWAHAAERFFAVCRAARAAVP